MRSLLIALAGITLATGPVWSQGGESASKKNNVYDEDEKFAKLLEKAFKKPQTERERVIKEFSKLDRDRELGGDFNQWFDRVSGGQPVWDREQITRMDIAEIFDRMAGRLNNPSGSISREQFVLYAREFWTEDRSPVWKEPKQVDPQAEADKVFRKLDRDGDAYLEGDELPETLRRSLRRFDRDRDDRMNQDEYRSYFARRFESLRLEFETGMTNQRRGQDAMPESDRPRVFRAGRLPGGLPSWFMELDTDRDGQVALYEWRRQKGRSAAELLAEFRTIDRDDDGFIIPEEALPHRAR